MKIRDDRGVQEKNYVKLWWIQQVNASFRYARDLIRKKWYSLDKEIYENAVNRASKLTFLQLIKESKNLLTAPFFLDDISNFAKEFNFEDFWHSSLVAYILTGRIIPPDKLSKNIPSQYVLDMRKMFLWRVKKWKQHEEARKQGYKTKRKDFYSKGKYMDDLEELLDDSFIHDDSNIADKIFGEEENISEINDNKRKNRIKTNLKRFREQLVPLTPQQQKRLDRLFS